MLRLVLVTDSSAYMIFVVASYSYGFVVGIFFLRSSFNTMCIVCRIIQARRHRKTGIYQVYYTQRLCANHKGSASPTQQQQLYIHTRRYSNSNRRKKNVSPSPVSFIFQRKPEKKKNTSDKMPTDWATCTAHTNETKSKKGRRSHSIHRKTYPEYLLNFYGALFC